MPNTREVIDRLPVNIQLRHCGNFLVRKVAVGILVDVGSSHDGAEFIIGEVRGVDGDAFWLNGDNGHRLIYKQRTLCGCVPVIITVGRVLGAVFHRILDGGNREHIQPGQLVAVAVKILQDSVVTHV